MAVTEAFWDKFDFLHHGTSLLPAVTYTSTGQNNEDSKASGEKRNYKSYLIAFTLVMRTKERRNKKEQMRQASCFEKGQSIYIDWALLTYFMV